MNLLEALDKSVHELIAMNNEQADRINKLEKRIVDLEARPYPQVAHFAGFNYSQPSVPIVSEVFRVKQINHRRRYNG